jgi:hypothetical protein
VTEAAVRKRIQRGSLGKKLGQDGRVYVYVYLDLSQDTSHPESQVHRDPMVEELVEELRDRVAFLERSLERRSVEAERYQQIVTELTQTNNNFSARMLELEAPTETSAPYQPSEEGAKDAANGAVGPPGLQRATRELRTALRNRVDGGCSAVGGQDHGRELRLQPRDGCASRPKRGTGFGRRVG